MNTFKVTIIREAGPEPLSGRLVDQAREELEISAQNEHEAYRKSQVLSSLKFTGQLRRTFINGEEYFDPRH